MVSVRTSVEKKSAGEAAVRVHLLGLGRLQEEQTRAEHEQDRAANTLEDQAVIHEERGDDRDAKGRERPVERVGNRGAEPGHESREFSVRDRALDAEDGDGADGRGEAEPDDQSLDEEVLHPGRSL